MKLRNKKTGEIYTACRIIFGESIEGLEKNQWKTLEEFNEDWEDYEEPEVIYYLSWDGVVLHSADKTGWKNAKQIGNYFETEEEAEKAVEKLKIFNKLKQKGFVFSGWYYSTEGQLVILADNHEFSETEPEDLTKLFGDKIC